MSAGDNNRPSATPAVVDRALTTAAVTLLGAYFLLIAGMLAANIAFASPAAILRALSTPEILAALRLSLITATVSTLFAMLIATPAGYLLARGAMPAQRLVDALLDVPVVLPPIVVGFSLLALFHTPPGREIQETFHAVTGWRIAFDIPAIVLAQTLLATAYATRVCRAAFEQIDMELELVALTLGCDRRAAFLRVAVPSARNGLVNAATLAWSRAIGEFGPVLVFAGVTRGRTEVLSTAIFLEIETGRLESAAAVSLLLVTLALVVVTGLRWTLGRST